MINHKRIKSGYDAEILLGSNFFLKTIQTAFDSGVLPTDFTILDNNTIQLLRPIALNIIESVLLKHDGSSALTAPADFEITFPAQVVGPANTVPLNDITVSFVLDTERITNPKTGMVDKIKLEFSYVTLDHSTLTALEALQLREEFENTLKDSPYKLTEPLVSTNDVQKMDITKFPGTDKFQACIGLYINFKIKIGDTQETEMQSGTARVKLLPPEPDEMPIDRGVTSKGMNFLPPDQDVAMGTPKDIYLRLARNQLHGFSEIQSDGSVRRPLREPTKLTGPDEKGPIVGSHVALTVGPVPAHTPPLGSLPDRWNIGIVSHVHIRKADVHAKSRITLIPKIEAGELNFDFVVSKPEADTSFFESMSYLLGTLLMMPLAPATGGTSLIAGAELATLGVAIIRHFRERYEEEGKEKIESILESDKGGLTKLLGAIPSKVTIVRRRVDPFFYKHFQVVTKFNNVSIDPDGMSFSGNVDTGIEDKVYEHISLVGRQRASEPLGKLTGLLYYVNGINIINRNSFDRPDPINEPHVFLLKLDDVLKRIKKSHLKGQRITVKRVKTSGNTIKELFFRSLTALSPAEAANLDIKRVLTVTRLVLVRPKRGEPYYRTKPDKRKSNNLSELPKYTCWQAQYLAERYVDWQQDLLVFLEGTPTRRWKLKDDDQTIAGLVHHSLATLILVNRVLGPIVEGTESPTFTEDQFNKATIRNRPLSRFTIDQAKELLKTHGDVSYNIISQFTVGKLQRQGEIPTFGTSTPWSILIKLVLTDLKDSTKRAKNIVKKFGV